MKSNFLKNMTGLTVGVLFFLTMGCASAPLKGITPDGQKAYLGPVPIQNTAAYKTFLSGNRTEVAEQNYIFQRLKSASDLEFYHNGTWYGPLEAYRGGMWLVRQRYQKGQDSREFIRKYVERAEDTGEPHLVRYPDGTIHIGSYVLYNELDLLEEASAREARA